MDEILTVMLALVTLLQPVCGQGGLLPAATATGFGATTNSYSLSPSVLTGTYVDNYAGDALPEIVVVATLSPDRPDPTRQAGGLSPIVGPYGPSLLNWGGLAGGYAAGGFGGGFGSGAFGGIAGGVPGSGRGPSPTVELTALVGPDAPAATALGEFLLVFAQAGGFVRRKCPRGPVLTDSRESKGFGLGYGYQNMLQGFGGQRNDADYGVVARVSLKPGLNTFQIQGLGTFTRLSDLAGRSLSICRDVAMASDGRPYCVPAAIACVLLGYAERPLQP